MLITQRRGYRRMTPSAFRLLSYKPHFCLPKGLLGKWGWLVMQSGWNCFHLLSRLHYRSNQLTHSHFILLPFSSAFSSTEMPPPALVNCLYETILKLLLLNVELGQFDFTSLVNMSIFLALLKQMWYVFCVWQLLGFEENGSACVCDSSGNSKTTWKH